MFFFFKTPSQFPNITFNIHFSHKKYSPNSKVYITQLRKARPGTVLFFFFHIYIRKTTPGDSPAFRGYRITLKDPEPIRRGVKSSLKASESQGVYCCAWSPLGPFSWDVTMKKREKKSTPMWCPPFQYKLPQVYGTWYVTTPTALEIKRRNSGVLIEATRN